MLRSRRRPSADSLATWLWARLAIAEDLHGRGLLTRGELFRAENDATFQCFTGPLKLRDGKYLSAEVEKAKSLGATNMEAA